MFSLLHLILSLSISISTTTTTTTTVATPLTTPSNRQVLSLRPPPSPNPITNITVLSLKTPTPPTDPIYCIRKPRLRHISEQTCAPIIAPLIDNPPASSIQKPYTAPMTSFGASPCHIELRNSERGSIIMISDAQVGHAAVAVLRQCEGAMGAGWGQFVSQSGWYVFVYGDMV